jgi:hypothetical protein
MCPDAVAGLLWKTSAYEEALSVPLHPMPPLAPRLLQDTLDTGMLDPLGGVNAAASDCTLTRRALPALRLAFENTIVVMLGVPLVLRLTSVTGKLTANGTEMVTVS